MVQMVVRAVLKGGRGEEGGGGGGGGGGALPPLHHFHTHTHFVYY